MIKNGIILVNKSYGVSSTSEVRTIRKVLQQKKAGHTGTLDLLATGLLVICIGRATKTIEYLQAEDKEYLVGIQLGVEKNTIDNEGHITNTTDKLITKDSMLSVLPNYIGNIKQIPPMHSAIKQNGKRLYELARKGIVVDREARDITIKSIELLDFDYEKQYVTLKAVVGSGTYIRSLVRDIALDLGTYGYMDSLVRTRCSGYAIEDSISINKDTDLETIEKSIIPMDNLLANYPVIDVNESISKRLKNGMTVVLDKDYGIDRYKVTSQGKILGVSTIKKSEKGTLLKLDKHLYI